MQFLIINLVVDAEMESADNVKVNMPNFIQKVDAIKKFQLSHNGGGVRNSSSFDWWRNLKVDGGVKKKSRSETKFGLVEFMLVQTMNNYQKN